MQPSVSKKRQKLDYDLIKPPFSLLQKKQSFAKCFIVSNKAKITECVIKKGYGGSSVGPEAIEAKEIWEQENSGKDVNLALATARNYGDAVMRPEITSNSTVYRALENHKIKELLLLHQSQNNSKYAK